MFANFFYILNEFLLSGKNHVSNNKQSKVIMFYSF